MFKICYCVQDWLMCLGSVTVFRVGYCVQGLVTVFRNGYCVQDWLLCSGLVTVSRIGYCV